MYLDIFTLFLLLGTLCFLIGTAFLCVWMSARQQSGMLWWGVSFLVRVPAFPLWIARGEIHDRLSIDLANGFILLGLGLGWAGTRRFAGRPVVLAVVVAPVLIWLVACQIPAVYVETGNRLFVISALTAIYSPAIAFEFWRSASDGHFLRKALASLFLINGMVHVGRGLYALNSPMHYNILQADYWLAMSLYFPLVILVVGALIGLSLHRERMVRALRHDAEFDSLTNVLNRKALFLRADGEIAAARKSGNNVALLLFDLDHFKMINDSYGHQAGDAVLERFSELVQTRLRKTDLFGRIGGEEFVAVLPNVDGEDARRIADMLRMAVDELTVGYSGEEISVSVSIGVADATGKTAALDSLMKMADQALYGAKRRGRNQVQSYDVAFA